MRPTHSSLIRRLRRAVLIASLLGVFGCSAPSNSELNAVAAPEPATLSSLELDVFSKSCALSVSCHRGQASASGLDLESPVYGQLVDRPSLSATGKYLVVAGAPELSILYRKLGQGPTGAGESMPPGQPLPAATVARVRAWIEAGAAND